LGNTAGFLEAQASMQIPPAVSFGKKSTRPMSLPESVIGNIINKWRTLLEPFESVFKDLHQRPELSCQEKRTAVVAANHLRSFGFLVQENIGGYGVVGVLRNGDGPTVVLRAEWMRCLFSRKRTYPTPVLYT
jgi:hypothetical protein